MKVMARVEPMQRHGDIADAVNHAVRGLAAVSEASFEAVLRAQDAPRAWSANNCRFAMTMLASPNGLNSCASFLAMPL
jgi:hypothetical protein